MEALKAAPGRNILVINSASIIHQLAQSATLAHGAVALHYRRH